MLADKAIQNYLEDDCWKDLPEKQLQLQSLILKFCDVDSAITLLSEIENIPNIDFDTSLLFSLVVSHASPKQALRCIDNTMMCPFIELQKIILCEGTHEQILKLKKRQLALVKLNQREHND